MATTNDKPVRARVLVDCIPLGVKAGQVIETTADVIKAYPGELDGNKAAVAYALAEGGKVIPYLPKPAADDPAAEQPAAGG